MIDLRGIARRHHLTVDQLRLAADLLEQGYQPGFIQRYRADETGRLPANVLWELKLEVDRQQRLDAAREKANRQLPKDAVLDQEAEDSLARAISEAEIEVALRCYRARRHLEQSTEKAGPAATLLEKLIAYEGATPENLEAFAAEQLGSDAESAAQALEQVKRLVGALLQGDTKLNLKLRKAIQSKAQVTVEELDASHADKDEEASEKQAEAGAEEASAASPGAELNPDATSGPSEPTAEPAAEASETATPVASDETSASEENPAPDAAQASAEAVPSAPAQAGSELAADESAVTHEDASVHASQTPVQADAGGEAGADSSAADPSVDDVRFSTSKKKRGKDKSGKSQPVSKSLAKLTPRQRRRRWLIGMLQPMKSLRCSLSKLTAYQQLMLGRGRRSQLIKTNLKYPEQEWAAIARDAFVNSKHPLAKWFEETVTEQLEATLKAKIELDALSHLEELAQERLLESAVDRLRSQLVRRPVRGHVIMLVDTVGPKAVGVAVVGPDGKVLATDEIPCSAQPDVVSQNVVRLGELAHRFRVTLVALTNGPARRFLIVTLRELMKQSASSGLRWTMAERGGAEAYAAGRVALKELSAYNRRDRAAIWIARSLQDPIGELLKVDINRLRLGSYQRELPQEPLKKLVRETIADCLSGRGVDVFRASLEELQCVPGVAEEQAQQIFALVPDGIATRQDLMSKVVGWPETGTRQALGFLRVYGSEQPFDATLIHPDDYRLAERVVANTELETPPNAPPGWQKPAPLLTKSESSVAEPPTDTAAEAADAVGTPSDEVDAESGLSNAPSEDAVGGSAEPTPETATPETEPATEVVAESEADESTPPGVEAETDGEPAATEANSEDSSSTAEEAAPVAVDPDSSVSPESADSTAADRPEPEYSDQVTAASEKPLTIDVEKLARGWQVGREKLRWVATCLQEPFKNPHLASPPIPMLGELPTLSTIEPGMCLWAVVVGVADFGAFVELGPDCSGLIHISRLSPTFVEDPHQVVQVGDLLMVWVVSIDEKKSRVALTALSPDERAAAQAVASEQRERRRGAQGGYEGRGQRPAQGSDAGRRDSRGGGARDSRDSRSGGRDARGGGRDARGGGRSRGGRPGGRGRDDGGRSARSVVVTSKQPKAPISDAMKEGEEPLRSFSDLLQFYESKRTDAPQSNSGKQGEARPKPAPAPASEAPVEAKPTDEAKPDITPASEAAASPEQADASKLAAEDRSSAGLPAAPEAKSNVESVSEEPPQS